jgi:serine/threonine-protein kinase
MPRADTNLADYLVGDGPISVDEVIRILRDVATALADMNNEIVHRDLKPQNSCH